MKLKYTKRCWTWPYAAMVSILSTMVATGCNSQNNSAVTAAFKQSDLPVPEFLAVPAALKPALISVRRGESSLAYQLVWKHEELLKKWLFSVIEKNRTSGDDIIAILGPHIIDLDRPDRDSILTKQYFMGDSWISLTLVIDLDPGSNVITDWSISYAFCGYCPHIFSFDCNWRLEGKMLAGCMGSDQEGIDTIRLPRLVAQDDQLRIRISNLAPEIEHIDQVLLGSVQLSLSEELDVSFDGRPYIWTPVDDRGRELEQESKLSAEYSIVLGDGPENRVAVFEFRNTSAFEKSMRDFVFGRRFNPISAEIHLQFDNGKSLDLKPVGTKFIRRIVVPIPSKATQLIIRCPAGYWLVRRLWLGTGRDVASEMKWCDPFTAIGPDDDSLMLMSHRDKQRLRLDPMQESIVSFQPTISSKSKRSAYVLRMTGFYEFQQPITNYSPNSQ